MHVNLAYRYRMYDIDYPQMALVAASLFVE